MGANASGFVSGISGGVWDSTGCRKNQADVTKHYSWMVTLNLEPQTLAHAAALKMYSGHTEPPRGHDGAGNGDYRGGH